MPITICKGNTTCLSEYLFGEIKTLDEDFNFGVIRVPTSIPIHVSIHRYVAIIPCIPIIRTRIVNTSPELRLELIYLNAFPIKPQDLVIVTGYIVVSKTVGTRPALTRGFDPFDLPQKRIPNCKIVVFTIKLA